MKTELTLPDGCKWVKLTSRKDERPANELSKTLVGSVFAAEVPYRKPRDGASHKAQFFLLLSPDEKQADVAVKVAYNGRLSSGGLAPKGSLVSGYRNQDPYPKHAAAIEALSKHVGVPLPREAYPYGVDDVPEEKPAGTAGASIPKSRRTDPLQFLGGFIASVKEDDLSSLDFDRAEEIEWPDLTAYGVDLIVAVLPTGKVLDVMREQTPVVSVLKYKRLMQHCDELSTLGFWRHHTGIWVRPHAAVHVDSFREAFPHTKICTRTLGEIVRVPPAPTKVAKAAYLLNAYGAAKFGNRWLPPNVAGNDGETLKTILGRAKVGDLTDEDADLVVGSFVSYGDAEFGEEWRPYAADEFIGELRADQLRKLLNWVDAENAARLESGSRRRL